MKNSNSKKDKDTKNIKDVDIRTMFQKKLEVKIQNNPIEAIEDSKNNMREEKKIIESKNLLDSLEKTRKANQL